MSSQFIKYLNNINSNNNNNSNINSNNGDDNNDDNIIVKIAITTTITIRPQLFKTLFSVDCVGTFRNINKNNLNF